MKLNFMHILADLGFGGVSPIYWNQKDKHAIIYKLKDIHTKPFKKPNEIQFGQKHQVNQEESTPRCDTKRLSNLYQNPNQQMIEEKNQINK